MNRYEVRMFVNGHLRTTWRGFKTFDEADEKAWRQNGRICGVEGRTELWMRLFGKWRMMRRYGPLNRKEARE